MYKRLLLAAAAATAIYASQAQATSPDTGGLITRAVNMYADGNYYGCLDQLSGVDQSMLPPSDVALVEYYKAVATTHTDRKAAINMLEHYLTNFPASPFLPQAHLALADCYYGTNYHRALAEYEQIDPKTLTSDQAEDYYYRKAYCLIEEHEYAQASELLEKMTASEKYGDTAIFYLGYIAYINKEYPRAEALLRQVNTDKAPGNMADYYLSQIYYTKGDYTKALSMAKNVLRRKGMPAQFTAEASRVAGESLYCLGDHAQSIDYLKTYVDHTEVPMPSAMYILGLDAYDSGDYDLAIRYLDDAADEENAMGQSANLYLGQAYLHLQEYTAAAMALNRALNMDYDNDVREAAYYNYAVASSMGGRVPFASTVTIFSDFLRLYPTSSRAPQVQKFIINSYLTDKNYQAALASIDKMRNPTAETLAAKQKVLYALGVESLANNDPRQALTYLDQARSLAKYDKTTDLEVSLAMGEAYNATANYTKAAAEIQKYLKEAKSTWPNLTTARYDMGYALFAQKKYGDANNYFQKVVDAPGSLPATVLADAYNRLGDCRYAEKNFAKAADAYQRAYDLNPSAGDYAMFQKALMAGFQREHAAKIAALDKMRSQFPHSALIPDALLETTEAYLQLGKNNKAVEVYNTLVSEYPNTAQARQGYLQMALVKLNSGDSRGAQADYRTIVSRYPASEEAAQAVEQLKRIAAAEGTLTELADFLRQTSGAPQLEESDVQRLAFEDAEKQYLVNHNTERLVEYTEDYPDASDRDHALAYLVEAYMAKPDEQIAYDYACALVEQYPSSPYAQQALADKATVEEHKGKGNLALRTWQQLADVASSPSMLLKARMGVIRTARDAGKTDEMLNAADAVLASSGAGMGERAEAAYARGEALAAKHKTAEARQAWESTAEYTYNVYGIRSAYALAENYLEAGDLDNAETWAKKVANADSPHAYWKARGFIVLSDVYTARGEKQKARQYLQALRDNYNEDDDIQSMIDQRIK